jgi:hypothetical protein
VKGHRLGYSHLPLILWHEISNFPKQALYLVGNVNEATVGYKHRNGKQLEDMIFSLWVLIPNRIVWDSEVREILLSRHI